MGFRGTSRQSCYSLVVFLDYLSMFVPLLLLSRGPGCFAVFVKPKVSLLFHVTFFVFGCPKGVDGENDSVILGCSMFGTFSP